MHPTLLKFEQVQRLIQKMIDRYSNFYEQRSASRDRMRSQKEKAAAVPTTIGGGLVG